MADLIKCSIRECSARKKVFALDRGAIRKSILF